MTKVKLAYSMGEIKQAGLNKAAIKSNKIPVDKRRRGVKVENVTALKAIASGETPAAGKGKSLKVKNLADLKDITEDQIAKLTDLGIDTPAKLLSEDVKELAKLTKFTQKAIKAWQVQIK